MIRPLITALAFLLTACATPMTEQPASNLELIDLTDDFAEQWEKTKDLSDAERIAAMKAYFAPIIPGFYSHERHGLTDATKYDPFFLKEL